MRRLLIPLLLASFVLSGFAGHYRTASAAYQPAIGYIEEVTPGYIKGWVYNGDQPVSVTLAFQSLEVSGDVRYYSITNQQVSNKIAYFSQRSDVQNYLRSKYRATSFQYPQGFLLTGQYLPKGGWRLLSAAVETMLEEALPILASNKTLNISTSQTYQEGYVDITSGPIKGWAYADNNSRPEIKVVLSRKGSGEQRTFVLSQNVDQDGQMLRTRRTDVESFLVNQRGQTNRYDAALNLGFTFNYRDSGLLAPGTWRIDSIQANGADVPFGNTNPSQEFVIF